jgi:hypothetical protein
MKKLKKQKMLHMYSIYPIKEEVDEDLVESNEPVEDGDKKIQIIGTNNKYQIKKLTDSNGDDEKLKERKQIRCIFPKELFFNENQHTIIHVLYQELKLKNKNKTNMNVAFDNVFGTDNVFDNAMADDMETIIMVKQNIKTIKGQVEHKINNYKQQDVLKRRFNKELFINYETLIQKLYFTDLQCYYCKDTTLIIYSVVREMKQWTVDRINNDLGHDIDNIVISCLECNLKKKRTNNDAFLFTKQLQIVKT